MKTLYESLKDIEVKARSQGNIMVADEVQEIINDLSVDVASLNMPNV